MKWILKFIKEFKVLSCLRVLKFKGEPIVIGGCGRSGTSLLLAILDAHPNIKGINYETNILVWKRFFNWHWANGLVHRFRIINQLIRDNIKPTARRWCEKTPRNVLFIPLILKEFNRKVRIIHIIRDGRDVCTSYHPTTKGYHVPFDRWVHDVSSGLAVSEDPCVLTIRYENLVLKYEETIELVLKFLDEPFSVELKTFHKNTAIKQHSAWFESIRPLSNVSIGKWRKDEHRERLEEFYQDKEAVAQLKQLNYLD